MEPLGMGLSGAFDEMSLAQWNARVLFPEDQYLYQKKVSLLMRSANEHMHTLVQEAGTREADFRDFAYQHRHTHFVGWTCGEQSGRGVLSMHCKQLLKRVSDVQHVPIVPGRALLSIMRGPFGTKHVYNIHNFDLTKEELSCLNETISRDLARARRSPTTFHVLLAGDFNFEFPDKPALQLPTMTACSATGQSMRYKYSGLKKSR